MNHSSQRTIHIRRTLIWLITLFVMHAGMASASSAEAVSATPTDAVQSFHKALHSGDAATIRHLLDDSVHIYEGKGVERSAEEYIGHHMLADMMYLKALSEEVVEQRVIASGDMAFAVTRSRLTGQRDGRPVDVLNVETVVLRRIDGAWKIVHVHWSQG